MAIKSMKTIYNRFLLSSHIFFDITVFRHFPDLDSTIFYPVKTLQLPQLCAHHPTAISLYLLRNLLDYHCLLNTIGVVHFNLTFLL